MVIATPFFIAASMSIILPSIIGRILYTKKLKPTHIIAILAWSITMVAPVVTRKNWPMISVTMIIMIAVNLIVIKKTVINEYFTNSLLVFINIIITMITYANSSWVYSFNGLMQLIAAEIEESYTIVSRLPSGAGHGFAVTAFGMVLATVGINSPIAFTLKKFGLTPSAMNRIEQREPGKGPNEPARGKIIGYLERVIVLLLIISDNTAAIGFVLAAKAFARFKQMDERDFAEYVLIGTLMSFGSTIIIGIVISALL